MGHKVYQNEDNWGYFGMNWGIWDADIIILANF